MATAAAVAGGDVLWCFVAQVARFTSRGGSGMVKYGISPIAGVVMADITGHACGNMSLWQLVADAACSTGLFMIHDNRL